MAIQMPLDISELVAWLQFCLTTASKEMTETLESLIAVKKCYFTLIKIRLLSNLFKIRTYPRGIFLSNLKINNSYSHKNG